MPSSENKYIGMRNKIFNIALLQFCILIIFFGSFSFFSISCSKDELQKEIDGSENSPGSDDNSEEDGKHVIPEKAVLTYVDNYGNELWAADKFKLIAKYLNKGDELSTSTFIKVFIIDDDGNQLNPDLFFSNFPKEIEFVKNKAESEEIMVKSSADMADRNIVIRFSVDDDQKENLNLLNPSFRTLLRPSVSNDEKPLKAMDERTVYSRPDAEFRSSLYGSNIGIKANMKLGDPHPNPTLAADGWKFYTAHEFHRYHALSNKKYPNNPQPRGFEKYKNYWMQLHSTFTKESTCRVTDSGHLQLWAQRCENNKVEDRDFNYFPMREDYLMKNPNPDMYNNWEVGAIISDAPHTTTHWADFRPGMRIEIRMRLENQNERYNPANDIWFMSNRFYTYDQQNGALWPYLNWPNCGEIDLLETRNPIDNVVCSTIHSIESGINDEHVKTPGYYLHEGIDYTKYNIYWMEWTKNTIRFGVNSICHGVVNGGKDFTISRGDKIDEDIWAPFTDDPITGTFYDWDKTWFTNPHGFRLILNVEIQKKDISGKESWSSGWNMEGPNDVDNWLPSWVNEKNPDKLPNMDIDWIRCYYDPNKGFRGKLLCPGGAYPTENLEEGNRPEALNY